MELPKRKPTRLKEYDYSSAGAYFITICTQNRKCILSAIVGGDAHIAPYVRLSPYGEILEKYIKNEPQITKYVIMPNHVHMIIEIDGPMWCIYAQSIGPYEIGYQCSQVVKNLDYKRNRTLHFPALLP